MKTRLASVLVLSLAASASPLEGCNFQLGSSTTGQDGRATYSYITGDGCFFGCDTSRPLMAGTQETLSVDGDALPAGLVFSSDTPAVISVSQSPQPLRTCSCPNGGSCGPGDASASCSLSYTVTLVASAPGDAQLVARAADGSIFDTLPLHVTTPASLAFHCPPGGASDDPALTSLTLSQDCFFHVDVLDAQNDPLQASSGFTITSADPSVVHVRPSFFLDFGGPDTQPDPPVTDSDGTVNVAGPGSTSIHIQTGGVSMTIPVTVP